MANSTENIMNNIPFRVVDPERIPAKRYHDEEFFKLEQERLWPHVWQMACRLEEIPEIGDYAEYRILDKSVIVVRTATEVKAFHNACRHRGVELASGSGNCKSRGFVCPFHGWRFNMDGENTFVFAKHVFSEASLEQAELNLKPCRVELWGGSAFINFDDSAPSLLECLGPVAERLSARNAEDLKMEWWCSTVLTSGITAWSYSSSSKTRPRNRQSQTGRTASPWCPIPILFPFELVLNFRTSLWMCRDSGSPWCPMTRTKMKIGKFN